MAYTDIDDPSAFFQTTLYTGDGGGTRAVTHGGNSDLNADWVWIKDRGTTSTHYIFDSVRGVQEHLTSAATTRELSDANSLKAFNSNSFTLGTSGNVNGNTRTFVSWNWKAGTTSGIAGSADITPNAYSFNQTSGFSIVTYNGTDVSGNTVLHGLGAVPHVIFVKRRVSDGYDWVVYHKDDVAGLYLNSVGVNNDSSSNNIWFNGQTPTSTQFHIGTDGRIGDNVSTGAFVAYSFAPKQGYSKFGSWAGNGNADGPFIYTGFKPAFVLIKAITVDNDWLIQDNKRYPINTDVSKILYPNSAKVEADSADTDILSNGFKLRNTTTSANTSGRSYIYMAFAENPFVTSTGVPATAR